MKRIAPPRVDDISIIQELSTNSALKKTSYPHLRQQLTLVETAYQDYINSLGNAWRVSNVNLSDELRTALIKHYKQPPKIVDFIEVLRKSSPEACPMCGGFKPSTLDHVLPKEDFPVWSIFSKNLVPACSCNSVRGTALKGSAVTQARVLHPYFDDCLSERLLTTRFSHDQDFKWIKAELDYVVTSHPDIASIKYHVKHIVLKNGIDLWLRAQMNRLKEFPANVIKGLPRKRAVDVARLNVVLDELLESYDGQCGSLNNWNSILIHGLLNAAFLHTWIVQRHNDSVRERQQ
ncbi:TPA: hypothetical protein PMB08_002611 [Vibrio cholerae]|nr:hypothetical protein [Vibrio cholerae]HDI3275893.1 hypothetical protein [Vibrio cholerae]